MKSSRSGTIKTFSVKESFVHLNYTETACPALQRQNVSGYLVFLPKSCRFFLKANETRFLFHKSPNVVKKQNPGSAQGKKEGVIPSY